ncbi:MAG: putative Ig domain-containing protein [Terriglobales bacterium]
MDGHFRALVPRHLLPIAAIVLIIATCSRVVGAQQLPAPPPLAIQDQSLPLHAGIDAHIPLHASGGVPPYRWSVASGDLPPGIALDAAGFLVGRASKPGDFAFTLMVTDSAQPAHSINKELRAQVTAALLLEWLRSPQVQGTEINGVVEVSNGTKDDDFDLTVIIVAVNEIGRATALGYQHMALKAGVMNFQVPFGSTLPAGTYVVHADAVAEIPARNTILRQRLQTPTALQIVQGP